MNSLRLACLLCAFSLIVGCGGATFRPQPLPPGSVERPSEIISGAPWYRTFNLDLQGPFARGDRLLEGGNRVEALKEYELLYQQILSSPLRSSLLEESALRVVCLHLEAGNPKSSLSRISGYVKDSGRATEVVSPNIALVTSAAYRELNDADQSLAWASVANRRATLQVRLRDLARVQASSILKELTNERLDQLKSRWSLDSFVGPLLEAEVESRRQQLAVSGGNLGLPPAAGSVVAPSSGLFKVGILVPMTGKFSAFGDSVRRGIELAFRDAPPKVPYNFIVKDTGGGGELAAQGYQSLVSEGAAFVLGPLLVRDSELVAERSQQLGIPFLTFAKRAGLTSLSPLAFRLGATAADQAREAAEFGIKVRGAKQFAIASTELEGSKELSEAFEKSIVSLGGKVVARVVIHEGDVTVAETAVAEVERSGAQGIFVADSLEIAEVFLKSVAGRMIGEGQPERVILGTALWDDAALIRQLGPSFPESYFVTPYFSGSVDPAVEQFRDRYRMAYSAEPDLVAAQAYDSAKLLLKSAELGDTSPNGLTMGLKSAETIRGISGILSVASSREVTRRMSVVKISGGELSEVSIGGNFMGFTASGQTP